MVIEEEWFAYMNLTGGATFPMALAKRTKSRINQNNFHMTQSDAYAKLQINNCWDTQVFQILNEERDGKFVFKVNMLSRLTKNVEISHEWVLEHFNYQEPYFYSIFLMGQKKDLLNGRIGMGE